MSSSEPPSRAPGLLGLRQHLQSGGTLWLFLDYDGTLVPLAPTPDEARPDADLLRLLADLASTPALRAAILSGRGLSTLRGWLSVPGLILAGTYGVDVVLGDGRTARGLATEPLRPRVEQVMAAWAGLIQQRPGFLLEDKGLSVALHARWAAPEAAADLLPRARAAAEAMLPAGDFRVLDGDRFLEVAPATAHKGRTVEWLLERYPLRGARPVYFGDDDKDAEALPAIQAQGGLFVAVGPRLPAHPAMIRLESPVEVRSWLASLVQAAQAAHPEGSVSER